MEKAGSDGANLTRRDAARSQCSVGFLAGGRRRVECFVIYREREREREQEVGMGHMARKWATSKEPKPSFLSPNVHIDQNSPHALTTGGKFKKTK